MTIRGKIITGFLFMSLLIGLVGYTGFELMTGHHEGQTELAAGVILIVSVCAVCLGLVTSLVITETVATRLALLRKVLAEINRGELTAGTDLFSRDEFGALSASFREMALTLHSSRQEIVAGRNYLDSIIRSMTDSLIVVSTDGLIRSVNPATCRLLRYGEAELTGRPYGAVLAGFSPDTPLFCPIPLSGGETSAEWAYRSADSRTVPVVYSAAPLRNREGNVEGVVCLAHDIAARKEAEDAVRDTNLTLETVINAAPVPIVALDRELRVTIWNPAAERVFGWSSGEVIGRSYPLIAADNEKELRQLAEIIIEGKSIVNHEVVRLARDGTSIDVSLSTAPLANSRGTINGSVGILADIRERKKRDEELRRYADELRESNEETRSFAYIVSHDLRAPLVNIKGFAAELRTCLNEADAMLSPLIPRLADEQRERLATILQVELPEAMQFIDSSVTRMDTLIGAILKLSRLGKGGVHPEPVDAGRLVATIVRSLTHQIERHAASVTCGELPHICVDRTAIEQVFGNLLDNAVKFLEPGRTGRITITAERGERGAIFHIGDNGRGIAAEDMGKIFEIFRRAGLQNVPGDGMGLAYVRALVRRMGGRIWCVSTPGEGSTFSFSVPDRPETGAS